MMLGWYTVLTSQSHSYRISICLLSPPTPSPPTHTTQFNTTPHTSSYISHHTIQHHSSTRHHYCTLLNGPHRTCVLHYTHTCTHTHTQTDIHTHMHTHTHMQIKFDHYTITNTIVTASYYLISLLILINFFKKYIFRIRYSFFLFDANQADRGSEIPLNIFTKYTFITIGYSREFECKERRFEWRTKIQNLTHEPWPNEVGGTRIWWSHHVFWNN